MRVKDMTRTAMLNNSLARAGNLNDGGHSQYLSSLGLGAFQEFLTSMGPSWPQNGRQRRMLDHSPEAIDKAIEELEMLRQTMDAKFCQSFAVLSFHRNDCNVVNKFQKKNPGLLCGHIFSVACEFGRDYKTLLSISHTCSLWHTLCAETPFLYQAIDVTAIPKQLLEQLYMKRAQHSRVPYSLTFNFTPNARTHPRSKSRYNQKEAFDFCIRHCPQIRELIFTISNPQQWTSSVLAKHAYVFPALEALKLAVLSGEHFETQILPTLFKESPKLRELSMIGLRMPFSHGVYVGLRKIYIETSGTESRSEHDLGILQLFEDSPKLEEFTFLSQQPQPFHGVGAGPSMGRLVDLPRLRLLNLKLHYYETSHILSSISTPSTLRLTAAFVVDLHDMNNGPTSLIPSDPRCLPCFSAIGALWVDVKSRTINGYAGADKASPVVQLSLVGGNGLHCQECDDIMVTTLRSMRVLDMIPSLRLLELCDYYIADNWRLFSPEDVIPLLMLSSKISKFILDSCHPSIIPPLSVQFSHSIVPYGQALKELTFLYMQIEADSILSLCESLASRGLLITLCLKYCRFDSQDAKIQLLDAIRALGIKLEVN